MNISNKHKKVLFSLLCFQQFKIISPIRKDGENKTEQEIVFELLKQFPILRDSNEVLWGAFKVVKGAKLNALDAITEANGGFGCIETVRRSRAALQKKYKNLQGEKYNGRQKFDSSPTLFAVCSNALLKALIYAPGFIESGQCKDEIGKVWLYENKGLIYVKNTGLKKCIDGSPNIKKSMIETYSQTRVRFPNETNQSSCYVIPYDDLLNVMEISANE